MTDWFDQFITDSRARLKAEQQLRVVAAPLLELLVTNLRGYIHRFNASGLTAMDFTCAYDRRTETCEVKADDRLMATCRLDVPAQRLRWHYEGDDAPHAGELPIALTAEGSLAVDGKTDWSIGPICERILTPLFSANMRR